MAYQHPLTSARNQYELAYRELRVRGELTRDADQYAWARATRNLEALQKLQPAIYSAARESYGLRLEYGLVQYESLFPRFYSAMKQEAVAVESTADYFQEWWDMGF